MDAFTDPLPSTYLTRSIFTKPTETGSTRVIAITKTEYLYLTAAYALILAGIFGFFWQHMVSLLLILYPTEELPRKGDYKDGVSPQTTVEESLEIRKRKANRYIALVTIRNASDPWSAMVLLAGHAMNMCRRTKANDRQTGLYDIIIIAFAFTAWASTIVASTIIPSKYLEQGALAPANPTSVFYVATPAGANPTLDELGTYIKVQQMKAPATQRALGIVEFARHALQEKVTIHPKEEIGKTPDGDVIERVAYNYNVTGLDFGLQHKNAINFVVRVQGACTLEYGWFNTGLSNGSIDVYNVFGTRSAVSRVEPIGPTGGKIMINSGGPVESNLSYAIIPDTVSRLSFAKGTDPWYKTVPNRNPQGFFAVANQRPVLSCWQSDIWSYGEHTAESINNLSSLPGLNLPAVIGDDFIPARMSLPMIYDIASALGDSILISSTSGRGKIFDASISNYTADLERLVLASYVATQNILRDTTMITNEYGLNNSARDDSGVPKPGVADFVIPSGEVMTLSLHVLIAVPLVWLLLHGIQVFFLCPRCTNRNSGAASRFTLRTTGFQPAQMYRLLDEEVCGYRDDWYGRKGELPYIREAGQVLPEVAPTRMSQITDTSGISKVASGVSEIKDPANIPAPEYALFAAPKVKKHLDNYHLKFTGPVPRAKSKEGWSWGIDVVDGPTSAGEIVDEQPCEFQVILTL